MLLKLRVQNKGHQKPLSRPEALQEDPEACSWNSQEKTAQICVPFHHHAGQFIFAFCHCPWRHRSLAIKSVDLHHSPRMAILLNWWRELMHCRCLIAMTGRVRIV